MASRLLSPRFGFKQNQRSHPRAIPLIPTKLPRSQPVHSNGDSAAQALVPFSRGGQQLQANRERIYSQRLAIDHASTSPKICGKGVNVKPLVPLPWLAGDHARTMHANVFREAFLDTLAHVETAQIYPRRDRLARFQTLGHSLHGTPQANRAGWEAEIIGVGTTWACKAKQ